MDQIDKIVRQQMSMLEKLQSPWFKAVMELQDTIQVATTYFYQSKNISAVHLPITTSSVSSPMGLGSDSLPVSVNMFGVETYLSDSMQFLLEYACRLSKKGTYYIMPSFRGEMPDETHLCQFYHSEAEIFGDLDDVIKLVEEYLSYLCQSVLLKNSAAVQAIAGKLDHVEKIASSNRFEQISFNEACDFLLSLGLSETIERHTEGFRTINRKGELKLIEEFGGIVWLREFDKLSVPFYQASSGDKALAADLLFGAGETVGAGERHTNYEEVVEALNFHQVDVSHYDWYVEMKKVYPLKTSGFGMGLERFMAWVFQYSDVRDLQLIERINGKSIAP